MNDQQETTQGKLAQESMLFVALAHRHPIIALAMREGWFGPKAQAIAEKNETRVMSKTAMWQIVMDVQAQLEEDEWRENFVARKTNLSKEDFQILKEQVVKLHDPKAYAEDLEKVNATDPT